MSIAWKTGVLYININVDYTTVMENEILKWEYSDISVKQIFRGNLLEYRSHIRDEISNVALFYWIYDYVLNQCQSQQKLRVWIPHMASCTRYNIMW